MIYRPFLLVGIWGGAGANFRLSEYLARVFGPRTGDIAIERLGHFALLHREKNATPAKCLRISREKTCMHRIFLSSRIVTQRSFSKPRSRTNKKSGLESSRWGDAKCRSRLIAISPVRGPKTVSYVPKVESPPAPPPPSNTDRKKRSYSFNVVMILLLRTTHVARSLRFTFSIRSCVTHETSWLLACLPACLLVLFILKDEKRRNGSRSFQAGQVETHSSRMVRRLSLVRHSSTGVPVCLCACVSSSTGFSIGCLILSLVGELAVFPGLGRLLHCIMSLGVTPSVVIFVFFLHLSLPPSLTPFLFPMCVSSS